MMILDLAVKDSNSHALVGGILTGLVIAVVSLLLIFIAAKKDK